jgi:DNA-binding CsgD family transcriptional regulator
MADGRLKILVALADKRRAEELAAHLGESEAMVALLAEEADGFDADAHFDAVVTDVSTRSLEIPTVLIAEGQGGVRRSPEVRAVLRPSASDTLIAAAIRLAVAGYAVSAGPERAPSAARREETGPFAPVSLTQREREVIALLAEGASNKLIARRLDISVHTAKFHVAAILEKLGAVNRTDAIAIAMREGLVLV